MTEIKKARISKIILVFDDGSTIELNDADILKMRELLVLLLEL